MPKKARASSTFGRKSASTGAKAKAKQREDEDFATEEGERQRELMVLRRQDSEVREKERQYEEERRKNKKFREEEREKDKKAKRESRESWLARKQAEEKQRDAIIREKQTKLYTIHLARRRHREVRAVFLALGIDPQKCQKEFENWLPELRKKDIYEYFRASTEEIWTWPCDCESYGEECPAHYAHLHTMLWWSDTRLSLSHEWTNKVLEILKKGNRCIAFLHVPVPTGFRHDRLLEPCQRCQISKEARAKLIDFWNHRQLTKTEFRMHSTYKCVCEKEAVLPEDGEEDSENKFYLSLVSCPPYITEDDSGEEEDSEDDSGEEEDSKDDSSEEEDSDEDSDEEEEGKGIEEQEGKGFEENM